jgi:hypothetical protein
MNVDILYEKYVRAYEIESKETSSLLGLKRLGELHMLFNLTKEEFIRKLDTDSEFKQKWGN